MKLILQVCVLSLLTVCLSSRAMTINDLTPGKTVAGPNLGVKDLKGKVVFVVYWGTHCPICLGEIPRWEALWKKNHNEDLHIIGLESQNSTEAEISELVKAKGIEFQVTVGGNLKGAQGTGLPHGYLFGSDGKLAQDDPRGKELEKKIGDLIKETSAAMAGPGPYVKLASLAEQVKSGVGLGAVLKTLSTKKTSKDAAEAAEATMMYDALRGNAKEQFEATLQKKAEDPIWALAKFEKFAGQFNGDEIGKKAADEVATMKKDPVIKKEVEAAAMWKQIESMNEKLKPVRGVKKPSDEAFRKLNLDAIQGMIAGCQMLNQRYATTSYAKKAQALMDEYK